jgi:hypothetical protein
MSRYYQYIFFHFFYVEKLAIFNKIVAKIVKFTLAKKKKLQQFPNFFVKKWWNFSIKKKTLDVIKYTI